MAAKKSATDALRTSIDGFVADLTSLFRDSIMSVVSGESRPTRGARRKKAARGGRVKGAKRDPKVIAALTSQLGAFIAKNPGQRIEQIGLALSVSTKDLALSAKKLLADKAISTRGQKRATAYFPAKGSRRPAKARAKAKAKATRKRKVRKKTRPRSKKR